MALFLIASLPLLFCLVALLPWNPVKSPRVLTLVSTFLKGVLLFFPGYIAILIVRKIFGVSYDGFLFYLSLLLRDQLAPLLAALGAFLLLQRSLKITGSEEVIFITVFSVVAGFLAMVNITDALRTWGGWDSYVLFLLPALRIAAVLLLALGAQRFYPWEGREGWLFAAGAAVLSLVLALASFLHESGLLGWSLVVGIAAVLAGVALFAMRFPRVVRG